MYLRYNQEVAKYGKKDAIIALCAYLVVAAIIIGFWAVITNFELTRLQARIAQLALAVVVIGITFVIVFIKKQGVASIGFHRDNLWPMIRFGLLLFAILSVFGIVPGLIYGWEFNNIGAIMYFLFFAFILAAWEDIFMVGYLQTRLYGLFKSHIIAILVGAVLFALPHIPMGLIGNTGTNLGVMLIAWFLGHLSMVLVFRRHFSLVPVFIRHTFHNFFMAGYLWGVFNPEYNTSWAGTAPIVILVMLVVMEIRRTKSNLKGVSYEKSVIHTGIFPVRCQRQRGAKN